MDNTTEKLPLEILTLIERAKCPVCKHCLELGHDYHGYDYIPIDLAHPGFPEQLEGKNRSDGWNLTCSKDQEHNIADVFTPEETQALIDWLLLNANED